MLLTPGQQAEVLARGDKIEDWELVNMGVMNQGMMGHLDIQA